MIIAVEMSFKIAAGGSPRFRVVIDGNKVFVEERGFDRAHTERWTERDPSELLFSPSIIQRIVLCHLARYAAGVSEAAVSSSSSKIRTIDLGVLDWGLQVTP